jgi:esterase/lipase
MKLLLKIIGILYILFSIAVYALQERFIFNAEKIEESFNYGSGIEVEIPLDENVNMNALWIKEKVNNPKGVILYLHGNRGSIRFGTYQIRHMRDLGYDIFIPDYRSYGKTEGQICCEEQMLNDIQKSYDFLKTKYAENKISIIGYSLGSGFASYLAGHNKPNQLLLIAPFTSLTDIKNKYLWFIPDFLLKFKLPVTKFLETTECPITIVHGDADRIVDYKFSKDLKSKFGTKVNLVTAVNISHRRIIFDGVLKSTILTLF